MSLVYPASCCAASAVARIAACLALTATTSAAGASTAAMSSTSAGPAHAVITREFIADPAPTRASHAGTLVDTPHGLVAAWFGGTHERDPSVGIWVSRRQAQGWTPPKEVAHGVQADGTRLPTWNPVLFRSREGTLMLFYKVGADPQHWWGMVAISRDDGAHWSAGHALPPGILGPIKNKPVQLADGSIVSPSSTEQGAWRIHMERSTDDGWTWQREPDVAGAGVDAIQPSLLVHPDGTLQAIGRTRQGRLFDTRSSDGGLHWTPLRLLDADNPNAGIDAVALADGRYLLVYNPTLPGKDWWDGRGTLAVALSKDGAHWRRVLTLEDRPGKEYSYPAVIQSADGRVHVLYTWERSHMRHVVIDPARLTLPSGGGASD